MHYPDEWDAISPGDVIDARQLGMRIDHLRDDPDVWEGIENPDDVAEELAELETFETELLTVGELRDITVVHENLWTAYAAEYLEASVKSQRVQKYINYELWAEDLADDYTSVEWGGATYYVI